MQEDIYQYIVGQEAAYKTAKVPIVDGMEWSMYEHIRLSTLYKNSKFSTGADDGNRPFKNIIRPILNVAYRSEGFDVKDIEVYVNDAKNYYKSMLVRKFHNKWARDNDLDTFIDDIVESYVDYGGILAKDVNDIRPEVVPLQRLAFCDQTNILTGIICEKHSYSPTELLDMADYGWGDESNGATATLQEVIKLSKSEKTANTLSGQKAKTPGKYIEVYELHGSMPDGWLTDDANKDDEEKYSAQIQIVCFYKKDDNNKAGITLFKGKEKTLPYKFLSRDKIYGRALGYGGIEELFEPQIWTNYNMIQVKDMLDVASIMIAQTADKSFANSNKITDLPKGQIVTYEDGKPLTQVVFQPVNIELFNDAVDKWEIQARTTGSANDAQLGISPTSGTPFALQNLVTSTGQGIHEYRRGKISTFLEEIYRDWILPYLVKEINNGHEWLDELDIDELQYVAEQVATNKANRQAVDLIIKYAQGKGESPNQAMVDTFKNVTKETWLKGGNDKFIQIIEDEFKDIPMDVFVNIAGKQKDLGRVASGLTNVFRQIFANPTVLQNPGMADLFNQIVEASGFSPVNFAGMEAPAKGMPVPPAPVPTFTNPVV